METHLTYNALDHFDSHKSIQGFLLLNDIKLDIDPLLQGLCGLLLKSHYRLQLVTECCYFGTSFIGCDWAIIRLS